MASVAARGWAMCAVSLLNFAFVFVSGVDFIRFVSFRAIYHNITGETTLCQGKRRSLARELPPGSMRVNEADRNFYK